jgi:hypothetical protein
MAASGIDFASLGIAGFTENTTIDSLNAADDSTV